MRFVSFARIWFVAAVLSIGACCGGFGPVQHAQAQTFIGNLLARLRGETLPAGIVRSNGRLEGTQLDVASKYPGRLVEVDVREGDEVTAGQVVGRIVSPEYEAEMRGAQAQVSRAEHALAEAKALIAQRKSTVDFSSTDYDRARRLLTQGHITQQETDRRRNSLDTANANYRAAVAQQNQAEFAIRSAQADVERLKAIIADLTLKAPRSGRILYLLSRSGEVVSAGARIMTILDLTDVYLTIFLPAGDAGRLSIGDEARIILDPVPQYVVPAKISFVASQAQFTPRSVETREEREKLMFRVRLQILPEVLERYYRQVKAGVRGLGFVRTRSDVAWPADLVVRLPQ